MNLGGKSYMVIALVITLDAEAFCIIDLVLHDAPVGALGTKQAQCSWRLVCSVGER